MTTAQPGDGTTLVRAWLDDLFAALEDHDATYAALRVDESLLEPDSELDLLVAPGSLAGVLTAVRNVAAHLDLRIARWVVRPRHSATVVLVWPADIGWHHYFLDIRCSVRKRGYVLIDGGRLRRSLTVWDPELGLRRLRDDVECVLLLVRNFLDQRQPNERHVRILEARCVEHAVKRMGAQMGWELTGSGPIQWDVRPLLGRSRSLGRYRAEVAHAIRALMGRTRQRAYGINVVLYGPDGVGKSTQASMIADFFRSVRIRDITVYHHLVQADRLREHAARPAHNTKVRVFRGAHSAWSLSGVTLVSYLKKLGFVLFRLKPALRRGHIFVHDRYLLDVFQKLQRSRGIRLGHLERLLPRLTPREPFVIVLQADPEVVVGRTNELSPAGVAASYELLFRCLESARERLGGWAVVDAGRSPDEVHRAVIERVLEVQSHRILGGAGGRLP